MIFIVMIMIITVSGVMAVIEGDIQWSASHFRVLAVVASAAICSTRCKAVWRVVATPADTHTWWLRVFMKSGVIKRNVLML